MFIKKKDKFVQHGTKEEDVDILPMFINSGSEPSGSYAEMNRTLSLSSWSSVSTGEGRTSKRGYRIEMGEGKKVPLGSESSLEAGKMSKSSPGDE